MSFTQSAICFDAGFESDRTLEWIETLILAEKISTSVAMGLARMETKFEAETGVYHLGLKTKYLRDLLFNGKHQL